VAYPNWETEEKRRPGLQNSIMALSGRDSQLSVPRGLRRGVWSRKQGSLGNCEKKKQKKPITTGAKDEFGTNPHQKGVHGSINTQRIEEK